MLIKGVLLVCLVFLISQLTEIILAAPFLEDQYLGKIKFHKLKNHRNKIRIKRKDSNNLDPDPVKISEALKELIQNSNVFIEPNFDDTKNILKNNTKAETNDAIKKDGNGINDVKFSEMFWSTQRPPPIFKYQPTLVQQTELFGYNTSTTLRQLQFVYNNSNSYNNRSVCSAATTECTTTGNCARDDQVNKRKIVEIYKKLAADFQTLQQCLDESKTDRNTSSCATTPRRVCDGEFNLGGMAKPQINTFESVPKCKIKNMITIENMNNKTGNFTRITLLKKKTSERCKEIDLPSFLGEGSHNNVKLQINQEDADILSNMIH